MIPDTAAGLTRSIDRKRLDLTQDGLDLGHPDFKWLRQGKMRLPRTKTFESRTGTTFVFTNGSAHTFDQSPVPLEERFFVRVKRMSNDCWLWTGSISKDGYALFSPRRGKTMFAHRWAYEHWIGPIPEGLVLDHVVERCLHKHCVNPHHLEPITNGENVRRGHAAYRKRLRETHCAHNHEYAMVGRRPDGTCAECARERVRAYQQKRAQDPEYRKRRAAVERQRRKSPEFKAKAKAYKQQTKDRDNADRRERYANDPEYRAKVLAANRAKKTQS
jgi:hypothetical protein